MPPKITGGLFAAVLLLVVVEATGVGFIYDFPQIFEAVLIQRMNINAAKIQLLYSLGTFPNLVSNLIASIFLEKLGVGFIVLIFQTIAFTGASLTYLAIRLNSYYFLCFGRIFVGISFDVCLLGVMLCCEKWFRGKILSISLGLTRFLRMISTSASFYFLPKIYLRTRSVENSAFLCIIICFLVTSTTSIFAVLDIKYGHLVKEQQREEQLQKALNHADDNELKKDIYAEKISSVVSLVKNKEFTFRHLNYIPFKAWIFMVYSVVSPDLYYMFTNTGSDFLVSRYSIPYEKAKNTLTVLPFIAAFCIPVCSAFHAKFGLKPLGQLFSTIFALGAYSYLAFLPSSGSGSRTVIALVMLAIYYGLCFGSLFPSLLLSIPNEASSRFLGLTITCQNMLYCVLPLICSIFYKNRTKEGYQNWLYFMMGMSALSAILAIVVLVVDLKGDRVLTMPENNPKVAKIQKEMSDGFMNSVLRRVRMTARRTEDTEYATLGARTSNKTLKGSARSRGQSSIEDLGRRVGQGYEFAGGERVGRGGKSGEIRSKTGEISRRVEA